MAKGLQCPACGHKHRLDRLPATATFRCGGCGQVLRNPARAAAPTGPAPPGTPVRVAAGGGRDDDRTSVMVAPPVAPPRRPPPVGRASAPPPAPAPPAGGEGTAPAATGPEPAPVPRPSAPLRLLLWVLAIPLGGAAALLGARAFGYVDGSRLLDMISGEGWGRFLRIFVLVPVWALLTAALVQSAEVLWLRRRARRAGQADAVGGHPEP